MYLLAQETQGMESWVWGQAAVGDVPNLGV